MGQLFREPDKKDGDTRSEGSEPWGHEVIKAALRYKQAWATREEAGQQRCFSPRFKQTVFIVDRAQKKNKIISIRK